MYQLFFNKTFKLYFSLKSRNNNKRANVLNIDKALTELGRRMFVVPGDDNCFYWALSTHLGRSNVEVRDAAVVEIINNLEFYRNYINIDE